MFKPNTLVTVAQKLGPYSTIGRVVVADPALTRPAETEVIVIHPKTFAGLVRTWVTGLLHPVTPEQYRSRVEGKR